MADRTRSAVALVLLGVWLLFMARRFVDPEYPIPTEVGALALVAAGYVLSDTVIKAAKRDRPPKVNGEAGG